MYNVLQAGSLGFGCSFWISFWSISRRHGCLSDIFLGNNYFVICSVGYGLSRRAGVLL